MSSSFSSASCSAARAGTSPKQDRMERRTEMWTFDFVVGRINPDDTVTGGTGVAAEYAKIVHTPLYVFDQERDGWFSWSGEGWRAEDAPLIRQPCFCGTGTRFLAPNGQAAIDALFARTFA